MLQISKDMGGLLQNHRGRSDCSPALRQEVGLFRFTFHAHDRRRASIAAFDLKAGGRAGALARRQNAAVAFDERVTTEQAAI